MPHQDSKKHKNWISIVVEFTKVIDNIKKSNLHAYILQVQNLQFFSPISNWFSKNKYSNSKCQSTVTWLTHKPTTFKNRKSIPALKHSKRENKKDSVLHKLSEKKNNQWTDIKETFVGVRMGFFHFEGFCTFISTLVSNSQQWQASSVIGAKSSRTESEISINEVNYHLAEAFSLLALHHNFNLFNPHIFKIFHYRWWKFNLWEHSGHSPEKERMRTLQRCIDKHDY